MGEYDFVFNENNINSATDIKGRLHITKEEKREEKLIKRFDELNELFPESISKETSYHLISSDNFGSIELLKVLINRINPNYVGVSTWSYNQEFIEIITKLLKDGVNVDFFVDKSMKTRKAHLYAQMVTLMDDYPNLSIKIHHMIHSKITILESVENNVFLSIEASANYSNNQRIENFTITENLELFNFHKNWMNEIIGK